MLLYVFTNDSGDREDCTVYYASYLLIKAKKADHDKVRSLINHLLSEDASDAVKNANAMRTDVYGKSDFIKLGKELKKYGYKIKEVSTEILTNEY